MEHTAPDHQAEKAIFDANLAEFANKVSIICALESSGKIAQTEAYARVRALWKELKRSRKSLHIDQQEEAA